MRILGAELQGGNCVSVVGPLFEKLFVLYIPDTHKA